MDSSLAPLLETRALVLGPERALEASALTARGPKLALWDQAGTLLRSLIDPRMIKSGTVLLLGREPAFLLASGDAAYVPIALPLPSGVKVLEALSLSAGLLGLGKIDARAALSRCHLSALESKKLGELTRLQTRLVSIAHGIIGGPRVLLLENVFTELDEPETAIVEAVLQAELEDKSYIAACDSSDPGSRAFALGCDQALRVAGNQIRTPSKPEPDLAPGYWVSCLCDVTPLAELLRSQGAEVTRSPRPTVLFVKSQTGASIFRAAKTTGLSVVELTPSGVRRDSP